MELPLTADNIFNYDIESCTLPKILIYCKSLTTQDINLKDSRFDERRLLT